MTLTEKQGYAKSLLRFFALLFIDCYGSKKTICLYGESFVWSNNICLSAVLRIGKLIRLRT